MFDALLFGLSRCDGFFFFFFFASSIQFTPLPPMNTHNERGHCLDRGRLGFGYEDPESRLWGWLRLA